MLVRLADERALLTSLADELSRAGALVSFNGKSFDAPLVETRCLYHRLAWTGAALPHLDMLHVARRLWKRADEVAGGAPLPAAWESGCSLGALERQLLGHRRHGDVSGFEIPQRYFQFVRTGDPRPLVPVFEHNRLDLLSLAALTARAAQLARTGPAGARDSREALALGWIYARAGLEPRARHAYERAVELSARLPAIHVESLHMLAMLLRRARQYDEAAKHWRRILEVRDCPRHIVREASDALAIHHEHRLRDLVSAREFALGSLERTGRPARDEAVRHRLNRIDRKLERLKSDPSRLQFAEPSSLT
jgi:tetratricopeptide (TPR) repeat protein